MPCEITDFEKFRTSMREVLEIIKASGDRKKMKEIIEKNPRYREIENEAVSAINVFTGLKIPVEKKERKMDMCKAWEDQWLDGKANGRIEGKAEDTIELLEEIGEPSPELRNMIMGQKDIDVLKKWHKTAARAKTIEEFEEAVGMIEKI